MAQLNGQEIPFRGKTLDSVIEAAANCFDQQTFTNNDRYLELVLDSQDEEALMKLGREQGLTGRETVVAVETAIKARLQTFPDLVTIESHTSSTPEKYSRIGKFNNMVFIFAEINLIAPADHEIRVGAST